MRSACCLLMAAAVVLLDRPALRAGEEQDRALAALLRAGATIERDAHRPGKPVIAADLNFIWAGDKELEALKAFPELRTVKLRECFGITDKGVRCLARLTQLQELDLGKTRLSDEGLKHLEKLANLRSLDLFWCIDVSDEGLRHLRRLTNLRHLDVGNCLNITDKGLVHLRGLTELRSLNLGGTGISDNGLVCLKDFGKLENLSLSSATIGDKGLAHLEGLRKLRSLNLSFTGVSDKGLAHLKGLTGLRTLELFTDGIEGDGLKHFRGLTKLRSLALGFNIGGDAMMHIEKMTGLRELSLSMAGRITDEDMKHLRGLSKLRRLELNSLRSITDKGLEHLRHLKNLRELEIGGNDGLTDKGLDGLAGLTNLRRLQLTHLEKVSNAGLRNLHSLKNLESLDLHSLAITDKGLEFLNGLTKLRVLRLWGIQGVSDETLKSLRRLVDLRELSISHVDISDAGLVYLTELPKLQTLSLSDTPITNRGLGHLKTIPNLKTIDVEDCREVTEAGVERFREDRPGTKVIQFRVKQSGYLATGNEYTAKRKSPPPSRRLVPLVEVLAHSDDTAVQLDVLRGMHEALRGRRSVASPEGWPAVYRKLSGSKNAEVRAKVLQLSVLFGDPQALAALRQTAADPRADATARRNALQALVEKSPPDLLPLLRQLLTDRAVRGPALRGLASYSDPGTPALILDHYASFTDAEKADAVATLASRPAYASALLDAMQNGRVPRRDLSAFTARQFLTFNDKKLTDRLTKVWGTIRPPSADKAKLLAKYKAMVPPDALKNADRKHGRLLFTRTCASCHTLFGEGAKIGPDLTGSQRANPEYLLSKLLDPSAIVARDYQMTVITTTAGRTLSGLVKEETDKTLTLQTQNEVVRLPKSDIEERHRSSQSMMPDGLLTPLSSTEVRDLIAYLSGAGQVPLPPAAPGPRK